LSGLLTFNQLYKVFGAEPTSSNDNVLYTLIENIGRSVAICTGLQKMALCFIIHWGKILLTFYLLYL